MTQTTNSACKSAFAIALRPSFDMVSLSRSAAWPPASTSPTSSRSECLPAVINVHRLAHRRARPRILTKKLDSTVWNPKVMAVADGITIRSVWEKSKGPNPCRRQALTA